MRITKMHDSNEQLNKELHSCYDYSKKTYYIRNYNFLFACLLIYLIQKMSLFDIDPRSIFRNIFC